jgi:Zn-dependent protease
MNSIAQIFLWLPGILLALTVHEFSHALAAYWRGDDTAKKMGRLTLNPLSHIDPLGLVILIIAHFGWAKPVPVNPYKLKPSYRYDSCELGGSFFQLYLCDFMRDFKGYFHQI